MTRKIDAGARKASWTQHLGMCLCFIPFFVSCAQSGKDLPTKEEEVPEEPLEVPVDPPQDQPFSRIPIFRLVDPDKAAPICDETSIWNATPGNIEPQGEETYGEIFQPLYLVGPVKAAYEERKSNLYSAVSPGRLYLGIDALIQEPEYFYFELGDVDVAGDLSETIFLRRYMFRLSEGKGVEEYRGGSWESLSDLVQWNKFERGFVLQFENRLLEGLFERWLWWIRVHDGEFAEEARTHFFAGRKGRKSELIQARYCHRSDERYERSFLEVNLSGDIESAAEFFGLAQNSYISLQALNHPGVFARTWQNVFMLKTEKFRFEDLVGFPSESSSVVKNDWKTAMGTMIRLDKTQDSKSRRIAEISDRYVGAMLTDLALEFQVEDVKWLSRFFASDMTRIWLGTDAWLRSGHALYREGVSRELLSFPLSYEVTYDTLFTQLLEFSVEAENGQEFRLTEFRDFIQNDHPKAAELMTHLTSSDWEAWAIEAFKDDDSDGLMNGLELSIESLPDQVDTDGDGWTDYAELLIGEGWLIATLKPDKIFYDGIIDDWVHLAPKLLNLDNGGSSCVQFGDIQYFGAIENDGRTMVAASGNSVTDPEASLREWTLFVRTTSGKVMRYRLPVTERVMEVEVLEGGPPSKTSLFHVNRNLADQVEWSLDLAFLKDEPSDAIELKIETRESSNLCDETPWFQARVNESP